MPGGVSRLCCVLLLILWVCTLQCNARYGCCRPRYNVPQKPDPLSGLVFLEDNCVLAFRATAGIGRSAYDRYVATGTNDDSPLARSALPCGCLTVNGSLPCDRHYRSRILDDWPSSLIDTPNAPTLRRFYINRNFGGCNIDRGWLLVAEADDVCDFVPPGPYPVILYSSATTDANLNTADFRQADVLTVTVKFKDTARFSGYCIP
ncbi:hypothetical protein BaRGS_00036977 [Batillaria attramentaria]|uniref:Uncharacterized protein n=1 Tax=Batillaria attramentaria TaxID=370345 RepID=A0ABD0JA97_9CAEN